MSETPASFKPKKSVALSGIAAGHTAFCTVGKNGNELHYRRYNILDLAEKATFEETAYLLIYGDLPNAAQLKAYKNELKKLRGLPIFAKRALERLPAHAHPVDVLRTFVSVVCTINPEKEDQSKAGARQIADQLLASLPSVSLHWQHCTQKRKRIDTE